MCVCVCVCVCVCHASAQCVLPLIKRPPDRNAALYCVHSEHNATQKLFLTCTLSSIWSQEEKGGGVLSSESRARHLFASCRIKSDSYQSESLLSSDSADCD